MPDLHSGLVRLARERKGLAGPYHPFLPQPFTAGVPVQRAWDTERGIQQGFSVNPWVYSCVRIKMERGATVPFGFQSMTKGKWAFDWSHPVSRVLSTWNKRGAQESLAKLIGYTEVGGNGLVGKYYKGLITSDSAPPTPKQLAPELLIRLKVENPARIRPIPDAAGEIDQYENTGAASGGIQRWWASTMCHAMLPGLALENEYWGMSRLRAIALAVDNDQEQAELNLARLQFGGIPDGILIDPSISSETQRRSDQKDLEEAWRNTRGPLLQGEGVDWISLGLSPKELESLKQCEWNMRQIVSGFGFMPALFGADATYSNSEIAERAAWMGGVIPLLNILASALTVGIMPAERWGSERVMYDISGVEALRLDYPKLIEALGAAVDHGMPFDTAKDLLGLPIPDLPNKLGKVPLIGDRMARLASIIEAETLSPDVAVLPRDLPLEGNPPPKPKKGNGQVGGPWG